MPIFEFECRACGHPFEQLVLPWLASTTEKPECPSCHSANVEKVLSICAISSEGTRQTSLKKARKAMRSVTKEKETEDYKQMIEHANEHH